MAVGIGRGISLALASQGADVVVADPDLEAARGTAAEVAALGVRSAASRVDIADVEHHGGYVSALEAEFGPIGILVNIGTAEEVAQAAVFLASEAALLHTGQTLSVNGDSP